MKKVVSTFYKALRKLKGDAISWVFTPIAYIQLFLNGVDFSDKLKVRGLMKVIVTRRGKVTIGSQFTVNSGQNFNIIGRQQRTTIWVEGTLQIGNNVGMSSSAIICKKSIKIGNDVTIGGNVVIYDTDFHALDPLVRIDKSADSVHAKSSEVNIGDRVFIGAHTTILKGVTIGENAIIGSCSLVSKNIPANEIWAGNPAKFIKRFND